MIIGMLWFDNSKEPLEDKVIKAADYYQKKHGRTANTCYINKADGQEGRIAGVELRTSDQVMRSHFWMGVEAG
jgi:hypothetical protein